MQKTRRVLPSVREYGELALDDGIAKRLCAAAKRAAKRLKPNVVLERTREGVKLGR